MELSLDINNLLTFENTFMFLALLVFLVSIYFLTKEKKKLQKLVERRVKVFQKVFDISEDAILVLSDKNKVLYANKSMIKLLGLPERFMLKPLAYMPKVKVKKDWLGLDTFIKKAHKVSEDKMQSFPQSSLAVHIR